MVKFSRKNGLADCDSGQESGHSFRRLFYTNLTPKDKNASQNFEDHSYKIIRKRMNIKYLLLLFSLFLIVAVTGYLLGAKFPQQQSDLPTKTKLAVTTSFYPLHFFASLIGGSRVDIYNLTPPGVEPHDFEPTSGDVGRIYKSKLLLLLGGIEPWAEKMSTTLREREVKVITTGEGLFDKDPHIWLSPPLAEKIVERVLGGLISVDQVGKPFYEANASGLRIQLNQLDEQYRAGLANCQRREIFVSHEAFTYLAQEYNLTQVAIAGLSPDTEPSAKNMAKIAKLAKEKGAQYIFFESLVSPRLSEAIAKEVGVKTLVLDPIEGIDDEQLRLGKNYLTVMKKNLENLRLALGCD